MVIWKNAAVHLKFGGSASENLLIEIKAPELRFGSVDPREHWSVMANMPAKCVQLRRRGYMGARMKKIVENERMVPPGSDGPKPGQGGRR